MNRDYNQVMLNTKRSTWGGSRTGAGRRRKATCQRNGRVYVALDMVSTVILKKNMNGAYLTDIECSLWIVGSNGAKPQSFTDYAAARDEFVRRVNDTRRNHAS